MVAVSGALYLDEFALVGVDTILVPRGVITLRISLIELIGCLFLRGLGQPSRHGRKGYGRLRGPGDLGRIAVDDVALDSRDGVAEG